MLVVDTSVLLAAADNADPDHAGIRDGMAIVMTLHTTTAITVNEGLPDLEDDLVELLSDLVPANRPYRHARFLLLGGGVMNEPALFPLVRTRLQQICAGYFDLPELGKDIDEFIVPPRLGGQAGITGALELARQASSGSRL